MPEPARFSVVILTLNEAARLSACLASVAGCHDVVVVDSGSTDTTVALARSAGARVLVNPFVNFAQQRNFAHTAAHFRHEWVFHLDADEHMTPELFAECSRVAAAQPEQDGFYVAPRMLFAGRWLRRCTDWPAWQARFVHRDRFSFVQSGHGQREAPGLRLGRLQAGYTHDISVGSETEWTIKHRRYARQEAAEILNTQERFGTLLQHACLSSGLERRRALKRLSYALPARPLLRFIYQYCLRGGFLDGTGAYRYCRLLARYEGFAAEELRRLRRSARG